MPVLLTGDPAGPSADGLTVPELVDVARGGERVVVAEAALDRVAETRADLEERVEAGEVVYGVNTGFGANADESIAPEDVRQLQTNLLRSHAFGVGDELDVDEVRATMLLRLNSLLSGNSGIRPVVAERLRDALNAGVHPRIPRKGSVSASGDLAPLAHMALVLIGEGEADYEGERLPGGEALAAAGVDPLELEAKEGLALVNGTNVITGIAALSVADARTLVDTADAVGALSLEAQRGIVDAFRDEIHRLRGHAGQRTSAERIREAVAGSDLVGTAATADTVQDEYSLRCMPQVHGATRDVIDHVADVVEREMNAVTDNPLVLSDGDVVSGGNFHGQPVALALDSLGVAVAELANVSERRLFQLVGGETAGGGRGAASTAPADAADDAPADALGAFLVDTDEATAGLNSGFMIPQVTAAALVSENKTLVHPASSDSVPTSDNQEDHVSMGANAANHLVEIVDNVRTVLGIEALAAAQALHVRDDAPGEGSERTLAAIREEVAPLGRDRTMTDDLARVEALIDRGELA
jgi:histidine ammonia-lyase